MIINFLFFARYLFTYLPAVWLIFDNFDFIMYLITNEINIFIKLFIFYTIHTYDW